jgi:hypothetical protein
MLAQRLRSLREERFPERKITQQQLSRALGQQQPISVPLISSWESRTNPVILPAKRLDVYATFFATVRSVTAGSLRLLRSDEMTEAEREAREALKEELVQLRNEALRASAARPVVPGGANPHSAPATSPLASGFWYFPDGGTVTIVCAELPDEMLANLKYANPQHPDFIKLYRFADLDSLFELHGHIRATNPTTQVNLRAAHELTNDDYTTHLVVLGGVDWNILTSSILNRLDLPVRQVTDWAAGKVPYFEVTENGKLAQYEPRLDRPADIDGAPGEPVLREDVALFTRAVNPHNQELTVTVCNGMYGNGTYGAVRALTDVVFRDRNYTYVQKNFQGKDEFCILTQVKIENNVAVTPDWTIPGNIHFKWAR